MGKVKDTFVKVTTAIKTRWTGLSKTARIIIISVASVVILSLIVLIILSSITRYEVLYSGASSEETAEIINVLQSEMGLAESEVKFNSATGEILVPADRVDTLKAQLAVKGYPKSTFNYNIWDSGVSMFSTESDKRVKQTQQLQENLRATLSTYEGVKNALVILNIPKTNDYVISRTKDEAGASVVLTLDQPLNVDTIEGIYNLVRTAVPGLKEENITVTDSTGALLTTEKVAANLNEQDETELYYKRLEFQKEISDILYQKLDKLFDGAFTDYRVAVDVQLNYNDEVSEITEYTPSVDSEGNRGGMVDQEKYVSAGGGNALEGGIVGTTIDADISPDYPTLRIGEGDQFYYEAQKDIHYLVNKAIKQIQKDGYSYDNISASVLVDEDAENVTQADEERWEKLIATAIGASPDRVTFRATNFQLDRTGSAAGDGSVVVQGGRTTLVFIIIALGGLLIILLVIALLAAGSNKKRIKMRRQAALAAASGANVSSISVGGETEEEMRRRSMEEGGEDYDFELQSLSGSENEASRDALLKKEIRDFSTTNPEIVAQLIRTWMKGDEA